MREWWANVYVGAYGSVPGSRHAERDGANCSVYGKRNSVIHVRLKPEGAPRRYADSHERRAWENWPGVMAFGQEGAKGLLALYRSGGA